MSQVPSIIRKTLRLEKGDVIYSDKIKDGRRYKVNHWNGSPVIAAGLNTAVKKLNNTFREHRVLAWAERYHNTVVVRTLTV